MLVGHSVILQLKNRFRCTPRLPEKAWFEILQDYACKRVHTGYSWCLKTQKKHWRLNEGTPLSQWCQGQKYNGMRQNVVSSKRKLCNHGEPLKNRAITYINDPTESYYALYAYNRSHGTTDALCFGRLTRRAWESRETAERRVMHEAGRCAIGLRAATRDFEA